MAAAEFSNSQLMARQWVQSVFANRLVLLGVRDGIRNHLQRLNTDPSHLPWQTPSVVVADRGM